MALVQSSYPGAVEQSDFRFTSIPTGDSQSYLLPRGFPTRISSPMAWTKPHIPTESNFITHLTAQQIHELRNALETFKTYGLDGDLVDTTNFPLPTLQHVLKDLCHEVHEGKGLFLIRGIKPGMFSVVEDSMIVFLGIQAYIAPQKARQDGKGNMIVHIIADEKDQERKFHHRHSRERIPFHNEETGDILAWQTRSTAAAGGQCIVSSFPMIYNILAATRPDVLRLLARSDWPFAFPKFQCRPILFLENNRIIINYSRASLLGSLAHPRSPSLPACTPHQIEALDLLEEIAQKTQFAFSTQAGDMHFINNLTIFHRRDGFLDSESSESSDCSLSLMPGLLEQKAATPTKKTKAKGRHLVRMRLRNPNMGWQIPEALRAEWEEAFVEEGPERQWHLEPMPLAYFPLRKNPN